MRTTPENANPAGAGERVQQIVELATRMTEQMGRLLDDTDIALSDAMMAAALSVRGLGEVALAAEVAGAGAMSADEMRALLRRVFDYALMTPVVAFRTQEEMDAYLKNQTGGMH